ncbi:MAG: hypothetical protein H7144_04430, partial [Burkholderiales bacterium]|nr:hypothetical protein [Phycisphaerae bacterium]
TTAASVLDLDNLASGLRNLSATLSSEFANMKLGGAAITDINGDGSADLDKLRTQLAQFIDFGTARLAGQAQFNLRNVASAGSTTNYTLSLGTTLTGINIQLGQSPAIDMPYVKGDLASDYVVDAASDNPLKQIKTAVGSLAMGSAADKLVLDGHVKLHDIDLANLRIGKFEIPQSTINDLKALQKMIDPFVPQLRQQGLEFTAGQVYFGAAGSADLKTKSVVLTQLDASTPGLRLSKNGKELVRDKFVLVTTGTIRAGDPATGQTMKVDLANLSINSAMLKLSKTDAPLTAEMVNGVPRGSGGVNIAVDLPAVSRVMAGLSTGPVNAVSAGALKGALTLNTDPQSKSTAAFDGNIEGFSIDQTPIQNQPVAISFSADMPPSLDHVSAVLNLKSAYATVEAKDISLNLKSGISVLKMVEKAHVDIGMKDFPNAYAMATALLPNIKLPYTPTSGGVSIIADVSGNTVTMDVSASRLALRNVAGKDYAFSTKQPVSINAALKLRGDAKIDSVTFSKLNADVGAAVVSMTDPLVVTDPMGTPSVKGQLQLTGSLDRAAPLLQFVQQSEKPLPYRGEFAFKNTLSTSGNTTNALLDGTVNDFVLLDEATNKPAFTEKQIKVTGDLSADLKQQVAQIKALNIDMSSSQAATISVTGGLKKFLTAAPYFDNIAAKIDAQGEKAWPLIFPLLPPENQATLAGAKLTGPINIILRADGAYDTVKPMHMAIRTLTVKGDIRLAGADLSESYGVTLANYQQYITLRDGMLVTGNLDKPKGDPGRFAPAFDINGGKGDFSSISINMGDPGMLVTVGKKQKILTGVQMNKVMAAQLGSLASVMFKDAKEASGIVDVVVLDCNNVPLADLMAGSKKAKATILYSVRDLRLDGEVPSALAELLEWGNKGIIGQIENGSLTLENGIAYQNMTLSIAKTIEQVDKRTGRTRNVDVLENMKFEGGVDLEKQKFRDYSMWISNGLLRRDWQKSNPNGVTVGLSGNVTDVKSILAQAFVQLGVQGYGKDILEDLLNQNKKKDK